MTDHRPLVELVVVDVVVIVVAAARSVAEAVVPLASNLHHTHIRMQGNKSVLIEKGGNPHYLTES